MPAAVAMPSCLAIASAVASAASWQAVWSLLRPARSIAPHASSASAGAPMAKITAVPPRTSRSSLRSGSRSPDSLIGIVSVGRLGRAVAGALGHVVTAGFPAPVLGVLGGLVLGHFSRLV